MDLVWITAMAVLWGLVAGMVAGLDRLGRPEPATGAAPGARP